MSLDPNHDGGLSIPPKMKKILDNPGFISTEMGRERLNIMFGTQFAKFNPKKLSHFALLCITGQHDLVKEAVESGTAPDLNTTQTPFLFGFVSFAVLGTQGLKLRVPGILHMRHLDVINYLIDSGASPDIPDISGRTALYHACVPPMGHAEIAKQLLGKGANMNAQDRFGETPLLFSLRGRVVPIVDILMERGADLDIADANGNSPRKSITAYGPEVTAVVQRWERKRKGEVALWEEKQCENCKTKGSGLKQCARCHVVRYCSAECQRAHWKAHKPACNPFCAATTVTLKPGYRGVVEYSKAPQIPGFETPPTNLVRPNFTRIEAENKSMVIKVQVPEDPNGILQSAFQGLLIHNKKQDFACTATRPSNPAAYDAIVQIIQSRGVNGKIAYFAAELKNPDELVVKISEVLAEQPF